MFEGEIVAVSYQAGIALERMLCAVVYTAAITRLFYVLSMYESWKSLNNVHLDTYFLVIRTTSC